MVSKIAAVAAIAGLAAAVPQFNAGDGLVTTVTTFTTQEITITSCEATVTYCPARTTTTAYAIVTTLPGVVTTLPGAVTTLPLTNANGVIPTGATGTGGAVGGENTATYNMPSPSGTSCPGGCSSSSGTGSNGKGNSGYTGPSYTGGAGQLRIGAGAGVAALLAAVYLL